MLCLSLFPIFTPSNFVRVIDSSVPCALAFWLCFVTPHLYQLASFQLGGLSNLKKKTPKPACWRFMTRFPSVVSPQPPLRPCTGVSPSAVCNSSRLSPGKDGGRGQGRAGTPMCEDGDRVRVHPRLLLLQKGKSSSCTHFWYLMGASFPQAAPRLKQRVQGGRSSHV